MNKTRQILLDTDIIIHLLKKRSDTVDAFITLREQGAECLISPIVVAEIYAGALEKEYTTIEVFFSLCRHLTLDTSTARLAGQYALKYRKAYQGISLEDYLLAATAKYYQCPLWTGNRKHYPMDDIDLFKPKKSS
jgi:predicted nucleic acid-binding protein